MLKVMNDVRGRLAANRGIRLMVWQSFVPDSAWHTTLPILINQHDIARLSGTDSQTTSPWRTQNKHNNVGLMFLMLDIKFLFIKKHLK